MVSGTRPYSTVQAESRGVALFQRHVARCCQLTVNLGIIGKCPSDVAFSWSPCQSDHDLWCFLCKHQYVCSSGVVMTAALPNLFVCQPLVTPVNTHCRLELLCKLPDMALRHGSFWVTWTFFSSNAAFSADRSFRIVWQCINSGACNLPECTQHKHHRASRCFPYK